MVLSEGRVIFATAPNVTDTLWALIQLAEPKVVVIEISGNPCLEYTALKLLAEHEVELWVVGVTL